MNRPTIGISIGDINGIGPEVILKTLQHPKIREFCTPVIYGSSKVISYHKNIVSDDDFPFHSLRPNEKPLADKINVVNVWQDAVNINLGQTTEEGGKCAWQSLDAAVKDLKARILDALVTAPINKEAMQMAGFPHPGHTEYLTQAFGVKDSLMLLIQDGLRVGLATNHLPIREVAGAVSKEKLLSKIHILQESLRVDFGIERPTIAVLGLNPHAGDGGAIGDEESRIIRPAVIEAKKNGTFAFGPFPADGFFGSGQYRKFDGILAMYHDQGLAPFKALAFGGGVNFTAGLPIVRTSPDHGTAFDIAGKNQADPASFREALYLAIDIARNRMQYREMHANALVKREKPAEEMDEMPSNAFDEM